MATHRLDLVETGVLYLRWISIRHDLMQSALLVWDPQYSTHIQQLESVQTFAARLVPKRWTEPYESLLMSLNWTSLFVRRKQQKLILCRRILRGESCLPSFLFLPHPHPSSRIHHSTPLLVPFARTNSFKASFFISSALLWNNLPSSITPVTSTPVFKHLIRQLSF